MENNSSNSEGNLCPSNDGDDFRRAHSHEVSVQAPMQEFKELFQKDEGFTKLLQEQFQNIANEIQHKMSNDIKKSEGGSIIENLLDQEDEVEKALPHLVDAGDKVHSPLKPGSPSKSRPEPSPAVHAQSPSNAPQPPISQTQYSSQQPQAVPLNPIQQNLQQMQIVQLQKFSQNFGASDPLAEISKQFPISSDQQQQAM